MNIKLRKASIGDLTLLKHWDEQPHVIAADPNDDWAWEESLRNPPKFQKQLIAELDDRPIGFVQIIDAKREESHYWGEVEDGFMAIDIWIGEVEDLGKGYGTKMMNLALKQCFDDPNVKGVLIDPLESNTDAHRFYERLGFKFLEKRRFNDDECLVYLMKRKDWNFKESKG